MTAEAIRGYDTVVIPMYIGVKAESGVTVVQIQVNETRVFVKTNTWVNVNLDASYFADKGTDSVRWIQNGGDGVVNQVTEVRIASVYAENNATSAPALLDMNTVGARVDKVWGDAGLSIESKHYIDVSAIPEGIPDDARYVIEATFPDSDTWGQLYLRPMQTLDELRSLFNEGYNAVTLDFYVQTAAGSSCTQTQLAFYPNYDNMATQYAVNKWNRVTLSLEQLVSQMDASANDDQVYLLWVQALVSDNIERVYFSGFELVKTDPALLELTNFGSSVFGENLRSVIWADGGLAWDNGASYSDNALIFGSDASIGRVLHLTVNSGGHDGSLYTKFSSTDSTVNPFAALQEQYDTVRVSFYIVASADNIGSQVQFTVNGKNTLVNIGEWVTVDFALSDVAAYCNWNQGSRWWQWQMFYFHDQGATVSDIYVSGFTLH